MFPFNMMQAGGGNKLGYINEIVTPSSSGVVTYTDPRLGGLIPTGAYVLSSIANNGSENDLNFSIGVTDGSSVVSLRATSEDGVGTSNTRTETNTSTIVRLQTPTFGAICYATFVGFVPNGIKLNFFNVSGGGGQTISIVLFAGVNCHVGTVAIPATPSSTTDVTAPGFQPSGIVALYAAYTSLPAAVNDLSWAVGFCDQDRRRGMIASVCPDNDGTLDCRQQRRNSRIAMSTYSYNTKGASIASINSDGFTVEAADDGGSGAGYDFGYLCFDGIETYVDARTINVAVDDYLTLGSASFTPEAALMIGGTTTDLNVEDTDDDADYMYLTSFHNGNMHNLRLQNADGGTSSTASTRSVYNKLIDGIGPAFELNYDSMVSGGVRAKAAIAGQGALITMNMKG